MKILLLKPSSLGDVVQAMPVLRLLKRHYPASEIYWWIAEGLAPLLEGDPDLAGVVPFHRKQWQTPANWLRLMRGVMDLRDQQFDLVIDLQSLLRSALIAWAAHGARTIGLADSREGAPAFYDYAIPRPSPSTHAVDWYLQVLHFLRVPVHRDFEWLPSRPGPAQTVAQKRQDNPIAILLPGARWPNKRWPIQHFCELARQLTQVEPGLRLVVLGSREDLELGQAIHAAAPAAVWNLAGQTGLLEMVEWIRQASVVVSNDTGPMHVAAALGIPVVALFGPTNPDRTGPYTSHKDILRADLPCVPCMRSRCRQAELMECLQLIKPAMAVASAQQFLRSHSCK